MQHCRVLGGRRKAYHQGRTTRSPFLRPSSQSLSNDPIQLLTAYRAMCARDKKQCREDALQLAIAAMRPFRGSCAGMHRVYSINSARGCLRRHECAGGSAVQQLVDHSVCLEAHLGQFSATTQVLWAAPCEPPPRHYRCPEQCRCGAYYCSAAINPDNPRARHRHTFPDRHHYTYCSRRPRRQCQNQCRDSDSCGLIDMCCVPIANERLPNAPVVLPASCGLR